MESYGFNSVDGGRPTESFVPSSYVHRSSLGLGGINPTPPNYLHNNNRYPHTKTNPRVPKSLVTLRRTRKIQKQARSRMFQFPQDKIKMVSVQCMCVVCVQSACNLLVVLVLRPC